jgi:hypothetical protein
LTVKAGGERAAAAVSVKVPSEGCWAALLSRLTLKERES